MRISLTVLSLWLALCGLGGVARASDAASRTLDTFLRARGASDVSVIERRFVFEGAAEALSQTTLAHGCLGFLVVGSGELRDVDVALHTGPGLPLDEDATAAPYAYVRACTQANVPLVVSIHAYAGRGELTVLRIESAPRELGRLPASIALAVVPGGNLEAPQPIGEAPEDSGVAALLLAEESRLSARGYVAVGAPEVLDLQEGFGSTTTLWLAGHCYRLMVRAPGVRGLTVEVVGPGSPVRVAREPARDAVELAFCAQQSGAHRVRVRGGAARGLAVLRAFEHPGARSDVAAQLALGAAELAHELGARALVLEPLGDAWLESKTPSRFTTELQAGQCYAVAAVSADGAPVDLRFVDGQGRLVSRTEGRNGVPIAYACATESGVHAVVLTGRGRDQRVSAWLGVPRPRAPGGTP